MLCTSDVCLVVGSSLPRRKYLET
ncbi:hypothetical protein RvY_04773 [Ramazzottius varieornatus]|uniref:Uncharacterized protein n=1 Tax=Ramazzottius varieornatus TaxID=947166 RepID=A0A1D1USS6_RAMVA|nr:hypothetical protein RvY_04773 [Ramazzottius varieornatus]